MFLAQILRATRSHFPTLRKFSVRSASSVTNIPYVEANIKRVCNSCKEFLYPCTFIFELFQSLEINFTFVT
jgi:hypothetical protein